MSQDDAITYFAFAEDNRDQPRRARSELHFIDIRPYKREYQFVDSNCQGGSGSCLSLEELIARQRQNLRKTFVNLDRQPVQDKLATRLAHSQREILQATQEFATGWQRQFGDMPVLHEAEQAMEEAASALQSKLLDDAMASEETAVAKLVAARQNFRKFLKTCSSGTFGQCKKYDNEMLQQLRSPPPKSRQEAQSVAETTQQLRNLAEQQRQWSEQVRTYCGSGARFERNSAPSNPTAEQLANAQHAAAEISKQLQETLREIATASSLSEERMEEVAKQIALSESELQQPDRAEAAADRAHEAARMLDQLAEHLAALSAADIAQRLALTEQMAARLALGQSDVASGLQPGVAASPTTNSQLADAQGDLARQMDTVADVLRHLEADAALDGSDLQTSLSQLRDLQQPEQLAQEMAALSAEIASDLTERTVAATQSAAHSTSQLATALSAIRREYLQPQLDELLAAEALAAELLQQIKDARDNSNQAEIAARFERLERQVANLHLAGNEAGSDET